MRAFGSVQNIQAEKLAQIALEDSTGWLKLSMNMANLHAWRWDKNSDRIDFAIDHSKQHCPPCFPAWRQLLERVHPKDRHDRDPRHRGEFPDAHRYSTGVPRSRSTTGSYRSCATTARPVFDADGKPQGLVGVTQDVTARRESEAKLRRSEQLLRTTTANTADTLILVDTELKVRFINRGFAGLAIEEIVGHEISTLLPEEARPGVIARLRNVLVTGAAATYEFGRTRMGPSRSISRIGRSWSRTRPSVRASRSASPMSPSASASSRKSSMSPTASATPSAATCMTVSVRS